MFVSYLATTREHLHTIDPNNNLLLENLTDFMAKTDKNELNSYFVVHSFPYIRGTYSRIYV